jgi:hypothetical protein
VRKIHKPHANLRDGAAGAGPVSAGVVSTSGVWASIEAGSLQPECLLDSRFPPRYNSCMATSPKSRPAKDLSAAAVSVFERVKRIKAESPEVSRKIDRLEADIRKRLVEIKELVAKLDPADRDFVTVLIVNGVHRTADETLLD